MVLSTTADAVLVVVAISKDLTAKLKAGALVKQLAGLLGGGGGGRPDAAQGRGKDAATGGEAKAAALQAMRDAGFCG